MKRNHTTVSKELDERLLNHEFCCDSDFSGQYDEARIIARHHSVAENAIAVLSNMPSGSSYICYGRLGEMLGLGCGIEEVASIWERKLMDRIHPDDLAEKIAWELQILSFLSRQPAETRQNYYLQHFLWMSDGRGGFVTLRHRIHYLNYDSDGNVRLSLCLYSMAGQNPGLTGIINSLYDTLVSRSSLSIPGLLSSRECEILERICGGEASKQIAESLHISINTVNNHRQNIMRKLKCRNSAEAAAVARKLGIIGRQ